MNTFLYWGVFWGLRTTPSGGAAGAAPETPVEQLCTPTHRVWRVVTRPDTVNTHQHPPRLSHTYKLNFFSSKYSNETSVDFLYSQALLPNRLQFHFFHGWCDKTRYYPRIWDNQSWFHSFLVSINDFNSCLHLLEPEVRAADLVVREKPA